MITLGVRDLEASVRFYRDGIGFPKMESEPTVAFFTLRGSWLGLFPYDELARDAGLADYPPPQPYSGFALAHNVESTAEVDALIAKAADAGAKVTKQPQKVFWGRL